METEIAKATGLGEQFPYVDTPELSASTFLYLSLGRADWLNGRYVSANWDLGQVEKEWKDKIVEQDLLINKLHVPGM